MRLLVLHGTALMHPGAVGLPSCAGTGSRLAASSPASPARATGRSLPDVLVEDDCESIGAEQITYPQIRPDLRSCIKSIVVPEFGGIDHLPDSLRDLLVFNPE